jgi:hypothetical protein
VSVVDASGVATRTQKDGVEGSGGPLKDGAKIFKLVFSSAQLVLRPSILNT